MARLQFEGIDRYVSQLEDMGQKSEGMIKRAVYDGAAVVLAEIKSQIASLPVVQTNPEPGKQMNGVFGYEKDGLMQGIGSSKMKNDEGFINTKIGFAGYNKLRSKKFPAGHPNVLIARAVNSGSSFRVKIPFVQRALTAAKAKAEAAMEARFDADTKDMLK